MTDTAPTVFVDLYQVPVKNVLGRLTRRPQRWRWRAINGGNHRVLAVSSEAYTNEADCRAAIRQLFGTGTEVYLRRDGHDNQLLRYAQDN
ncbi:hypothetical protein MM1218R_01483 [Mycobacterium marinum]|uniref:DUF1508 domain-containing protein n=1 Tax=Mycobacterium marinum TaxID=1781 RepID=UPI000E28AB30|nr:DUF1508 domain-containing protein [Mycobacterium marinum]AXN43431.1 hypothetical protein MM1218R_01483 [Mycobacterium marinum]RFZ11517.1 hypothetical protein DE4381_01105 [Mycobacterium marinum]